MILFHLIKPLKRLSTQNHHSVQLQKSIAEKIGLDQNVDIFHCTYSKDYNAFSYHALLRTVRDVLTTALPSHWHTVLANTPDFLREHQGFIAFFCSNNSPAFLPIFTHFPLLVITACSCHSAACIHCSVLFCLVLLSKRETDREMEKRNKYSIKFPGSWTRFLFLTERLKGHFTGKQEIHFEKPDVAFDHRGCIDFNHNLYRLLKGQGILPYFLGLNLGKYIYCWKLLLQPERKTWRHYVGLPCQWYECMDWAWMLETCCVICWLMNVGWLQ